jgi:hypothetical protein
MKWITVLFFIGFIGHETWGGNNDGDPAPGRSPGPPISTARYSSDIYSMESNSHEAYRPSEILHENPQQQQRVASDNNKRFSDLFSSMSHETEQLQSEYSEDSDDTERSQKLLKIDNPNEVTLNTLKNSSSSSASSLSHAVVDAKESLSNESTKNSDSRSRKISCTRVSNYLRLGDKIVQIKTNYATKSSDDDEVTMNSRKSAERKFRIDVTHDFFDASESLVAGIIYKGKRAQERCYSSPSQFTVFITAPSSLCCTTTTSFSIF